MNKEEKSIIRNYSYKSNLEAMVISPEYEFIPEPKEEGQSWQ